jgi:hypothetical protein
MKERQTAKTTIKTKLPLQMKERQTTPHFLTKHIPSLSKQSPPQRTRDQDYYEPKVGPAICPRQ